MNCIHCGIELNNTTDTFGDVGQEMCWQCWSEMWEDSIWKWPLTDGAICKAVEVAADISNQNNQRWLNETIVLTKGQ